MLLSERLYEMLDVNERKGELVYPCAEIRIVLACR